MIIVVTGIPRSGTSMMMRMLEAGGVPCVYEQFADKFNPRGYYEKNVTMHGDFTQMPDGAAAKCLFEVHNIDCDARVIIMRRDLEIAMASESRRTGVDVTIRARFLQGLLDDIRLWASTRPHLEVWYEDVLRYPAHEILRIARFLGRVPGFSAQPLDLAAMALIPDLALCHA